MALAPERVHDTFRQTLLTSQKPSPRNNSKGGSNRTSGARKVTVFGK